MTESPETPTPSLADRLEADCTQRTYLRPPCGACDRCTAAAQLRQLDRIKAAVGMSDPAQVAESLIESGDLVVPSAVPVAVDLLRRLADALEVPDADT